MKKGTSKRARVAKESPEDLLELSSWIRDNATKGSRVRSWTAWPAKVHEEILVVLLANDSGKAKVSSASFTRRMREVHGVTADPATLTRYCQSMLNRHGWGQP